MHDGDRIPVASVARPPVGVTCFGSLVEGVAFIEQGNIHPGMAKGWGDEFDGAVTMLVVVPMDELSNPCPGLVQAGKCRVWIGWTIFQCLEQGLRKRIIVAHRRTAV